MYTHRYTHVHVLCIHTYIYVCIFGFFRSVHFPAFEFDLQEADAFERETLQREREELEKQKALLFALSLQRNYEDQAAKKNGYGLEWGGAEARFEGGQVPQAVEQGRGAPLNNRLTDPT